MALKGCSCLPILRKWDIDTSVSRAAEKFPRFFNFPRPVWRTAAKAGVMACDFTHRDSLVHLPAYSPVLQAKEVLAHVVSESLEHVNDRRNASAAAGRGAKG